MQMWTKLERSAVSIRYGGYGAYIVCWMGANSVNAYHDDCPPSCACQTQEALASKIEEHKFNDNAHIVQARDRMVDQRADIVSEFDQHSQLHSHVHRPILSMGQKVTSPVVRELQVSGPLIDPVSTLHTIA